MRNYGEVKLPLVQSNSLILAQHAITTGNDQGLKAMFESKRQRTASMSSRLGLGSACCTLFAAMNMH